MSELLSELFTTDECNRIGRLAANGHLDLVKFTEFDYSLGGPSVLTISNFASGRPGTLAFPNQGVGRYEVADRDVFRPLQYCAAHLMLVDERAVWLARAVVEDSSAHIEQLMQRIAPKRFGPLGSLLHARGIERLVDPVTLELARRFLPIYNAAKHDYDQPKDTHMFSIDDALSSYFICRRLANKLYPLASLSTDLSVFDGEPVGFDSLTGHLTSGSS